MKRIGLVLFLAFLISCGKEEITSGAPSLIGTWVHYSAEKDWEKLVIKEDGTGKIECQRWIEPRNQN